MDRQSHPPHNHVPAPQRIKSRKSFLHSVKPLKLDEDVEKVRLQLWEESLQKDDNTLSQPSFSLVLFQPSYQNHGTIFYNQRPAVVLNLPWNFPVSKCQLHFFVSLLLNVDGSEEQTSSLEKVSVTHANGMLFELAAC